MELGVWEGFLEEVTFKLILEDQVGINQASVGARCLLARMPDALPGRCRQPTGRKAPLTGSL